MTQYRPYTPEERRQVVNHYSIPNSQHISGLSAGEFAAHAIDFHARQNDMPAFDYFLEAQADLQKRKAARDALPQAANDQYQDFMTGFIDVCDQTVASREQEGAVELSEYELFFGDIDRLNAKQKRLRTLFFNSPRYRRSRFQYAIERGNLVEAAIDDIALLKKHLEHYHDEYFDPTPRKGEWVTLEMQYDRYFGPRELLPKYLRWSRDEFFKPGSATRSMALEDWGLPKDATDEEARRGLLALCEKHKKSASQ